MFSKLSIRTKVVFLVSLLLVALIGLGLLAAANMRSLNANTKEITANWLPGIRALGESHAGVISYRAALRAHLLAEALEDKRRAKRSGAADVPAGLSLLAQTGLR